MTQVEGGRAQLFGVTYDNKGQADFLAFHVCSGPLLASPVPVLAPVVIPKTVGCFNGPMAGKKRSGVSIAST